MEETVGPVSTFGRELLRGWRRPVGLMVSFVIFTASVWKRLDQPMYIYVCVCVCVHIQCFTTCGHYCRMWFPRTFVIKSSYKHVSDFGKLRSFGPFLIAVHALVWSASHGISWRVIYSTWWLIACVANIIFATWLAHPATDSPVSISRHLEGI